MKNMPLPCRMSLRIQLPSREVSQGFTGWESDVSLHAMAGFSTERHVTLVGRPMTSVAQLVVSYSSVSWGTLLGNIGYVQKHS